MTGDDKYFFPVIPLWFLINYFYFLLQILYIKEILWIIELTSRHATEFLQEFVGLIRYFRWSIENWRFEDERKKKKKIFKNRAILKKIFYFS